MILKKRIPFLHVLYLRLQQVQAVLREWIEMSHRRTVAPEFQMAVVGK